MTVFRQEVEKIKKDVPLSIDGVEAKELWRAKIAADTEAFLARGGVIKQCAYGETNYETDSKRFHFRNQDGDVTTQGSANQKLDDMLFNVTEAAKLAGVTTHTIYQKIKKGQLLKTGDKISAIDLIDAFGELSNSFEARKIQKRINGDKT